MIAIFYSSQTKLLHSIKFPEKGYFQCSIANNVSVRGEGNKMTCIAENTTYYGMDKE